MRASGDRRGGAPETVLTGFDARWILVVHPKPCASVLDYALGRHHLLRQKVSLPRYVDRTLLIQLSIFGQLASNTEIHANASATWRLR